jgi:hypothetical protein
MPVAAATSSIEQMLIIESVNGMQNFCAARAAWISPSACCMPVSPTGAIATGIVTSTPTIRDAVLRPSMFTGDALAQLDLAEIAFVGAVGAFSPRARIGIVVEHARDALLRPARASPRSW